jgi:hypothetical protein
MAGSISSLLQPTLPHMHLDAEACPWCEQPIPHDRFEEISSRIAEVEKARLAEQEVILRERFAQERAQLTAKAQSDVEEARRTGAAALTQVRREGEERLEKIAQEAAQQVQEALVRGRQEAETAMADNLRVANERVEQAARDKIAAETALRNSQHTFEESLVNAAEKHRADLAEAVARTEESVVNRMQAAVEAADARLVAAEHARMEAVRLAEDKATNAERERLAIQQLFNAQAEKHASEIIERTEEVRESLGREMTKRVLDEQARFFAERQKLTETVDDLKRQLEKKSAAELGEGSEIDLFEALREAFEGDNIRRVPKGENGADVVHDIVENGLVCGTIVYDSKNRNAWQNNFAVKLRSDMIAAKADHAILSTNKFPAGARQLHHHEGVIIANPARVVALVQMLRAHIVQTNALRLSAEQREEKTAALYDYVTSERCTQLMDSLQTAIEKLETIDADEKKAHDATWNKRGRILKDVEKTRGTIVFELNRIIGTAETVE